MIDVAILGLLRERDLHGYELKKQLHDLLGSRQAVSFGSLYPALNRLEREGAVQEAAKEGVLVPPSIPMTGSISGEAAAFRAARHRPVRGPRGKKAYRITPKGEARLSELMTGPVDDDRTFALQLAFCCRWAEPPARLRFLERRKESLEQRLAEGHRTMRRRGERLDRYVRSLLEHDSESTRSDISWLDHLIATEHRLTETPGGNHA